MKPTTKRLNHILLAAAVALPLVAGTAAAHADNAEGEAPALHGGPAAPGGPGGQAGGPPPFGPPMGAAPDAGPGPGFGPAGRAPGVGPDAPLPWLHRLALSEAQQDQVFAILHAQQPYLREQGKAAFKAQEALQALASAEKYDDASAAALAQAAATANANIALQHVRTEQKLLAVLTAEQRKQLGERRERRQPGAHPGRHAGQQPGQPMSQPTSQHPGQQLRQEPGNR